jgi:aerobic-type carbon monoxide dehydrogenase small subunit (CoxS/CutS family)
MPVHKDKAPPPFRARVNGESTKNKVLIIPTSHLLCYLLDYNVLEGISGSRGVCCGHGSCGGCPSAKTNIREVKVSQLKSFQTNELDADD